MELQFEQKDVRQCWEQIKHGLEVIADKCDAEWRVEDAYAKCRAGEWTLFVLPDGSGFIILYQYQDVYKLEKRLVVECAYHTGDVDPFEIYEPFVFEQARKIEAKCVEFHSPRRGFERKGWEITDMTYRQEVDYGQKA